MTSKSGALGAIAILVALGAPADAQMSIPEMPSEAEAAALAAQGAKPGDDAMSCDQIGMEMQPFVGALSPSLTALGSDAQAMQKLQESQKQSMAPSPLGMGLGIASSFIPGGGIIAQAQAAAQYAQMKKAADAAKPLQDKMMGDSAALANQAAPMMQDARFQRLMQLTQDKCQTPP